MGPEQLIQKAQLDEKLTLRIWMVLGEGAVFVFILLLGFWAVHRSIAKELHVAEQQKNFLLSITHELKSPLAAIKLQLQTLHTRNLPEEKRKQLYVRALGDTDRVESGGLPLDKEKMNISQFLQQLVEGTYVRQLEEKQLSLILDSDIESSIDKMAFHSIVINLVDNAVKYGGGGVITVKLSLLENNEIEFSVLDNGEGIPNSEKKKIFERFYRRGNENVRQTKGTGIGLYLVKLLVERHGGSIAVLDNEPSGAKFIVKLPRVE
jgi:two-component system phosphate regulon sensor histidine kinase PhoR